MREYFISKISGAPCWDTISILPIDHLQWTENTDIRAQAQLCWDDERLYIRMTTVESDIRAELTDLLSQVCNDSCMEFFLRPTDSLHYFNFEFNPNCALCLCYGTGRKNSIRLVDKNYKTRFSPCVSRTASGWELIFQIPFSFIQLFSPTFRPQAGTAFYGNFYKCGDLTPNPHYLAWNPIDSEVPDFHRPQDFGRLILTDN